MTVRQLAAEALYRNLLDSVRRSLAGRDHIRTARGGFDAQALDTVIGFLPPATNQGAVRVHQGIIDWDATANGDPRATRIGSEFDFTKYTGEYQRIQPIWSL